ncbi:hypothetical protein [Cellulomonas composti]|uniref:YbjN domain-containing protein n=1 Tax=Cellulomonas composti TaxID=266130 RepID=A0A511JAP7_9CELL|nr:hypothetical protein [Cellulomonas composti]GEL95062.1 hypothetical protein CCO02nite_17200 [Cellulomonas composti]
MTDDGTLPDDDPAAFLDDVARAVAESGRDVTLDPVQLTLDVGDADGIRVLVVVRPVARAVSLWAVLPDEVPAATRATVGELVLRAADDQLGAVLELDLDRGTVSARHALLFGEEPLDAGVLTSLVGAALDEVEEVAARYAGAVADVAAGTIGPREAAAAVRTAQVEELTQLLADVERTIGS